MGDSEVAEGSVWEALEIAAHFKLDNLIGIIDVNRLGQRGETLLGHDTETYKTRVEAFGAKAWVVDGHDISSIWKILKQVQNDDSGKPKIIIAKTLKGKGVSFLEDKDGWHGKAVLGDRLDEALSEIGNYEKIVGEVEVPVLTNIKDLRLKIKDLKIDYKLGEMVATRKAYGNVLLKLAKENPSVVVLDAEVSNSTMSETVKREIPERFFEMFIAEQNMAGAALGFSRRGKIPFISTFAAFFSRAFDQIRMSQFSNSNIKFVGSHAGVSIGEDGASQMALEDLATFRTLHGGVVLYPSDAVSTEKLSVVMAGHMGNVYMRTTRAETPVLYENEEEFRIGGFKVHKVKSQKLKIKNTAQKLKVVVIGAGITLHEALKAQKELLADNIGVDVVDLYSIKPIDSAELKKAIKGAKAIITVEDYYPEGGMGEAVRSALGNTDLEFYSLAVRKMPRSGKPAELLGYEEIDSSAIINKVKEIIT
jgi:transketolase